MPPILDLNDDLSKSIVHKNVSQVIIVTTEDKLVIDLEKHCKIIQKKREWINPLGLFIAILTTILTSKFEEKFGLKPEFWQASFYIVGGGSLIWLIKSVYDSIKNYNKGTTEEFIQQFKK